MRLPPFALLAVIAATSMASSPLEAQNGPKADRNQTGTEEIRASSASNAHDLVKTLRPAWLRTRGAVSFETTTIANPGGAITALSPPQILVYVDGLRFGNQESLQSIGVSDLARLEFLDSGAATLRFGTGHPHGAIMVERATR